MALTKVSFSMTDGAFVNVQDFGAVGDGVANDTPAIQAAINYAQSNGSRTVYFPAGTYSTNASLEVTDDIRIEGESLRSTMISSTSSDYIIHADLGDPNTSGVGNYYGFSISNISLEGSGFNGGTQYGIWIRGAAYGNEIKNVRVGKTSVHNVYLDNCWGFQVVNSTFWNQDPADAATSASTASGLYVLIGHGVLIHHCHFNLFGGQGVGIEINGGDAASIVDCTIENTGYPVKVNGVDSLSIRNNYFEQRDWGTTNYATASDNRDQISIGSTTICYNVQIEANHFANGNNRRIFSLYEAADGRIVNNRSTTSLSNPCHFYIPNTSNVRNISVSDNERIFIAQPYTEAGLDGYYNSLRVLDRETIDVPLEEFVAATGSPALTTVGGVKVWAFDAAAAEEIRAVIPYPTNFGAGDNVYVSVELLVGCAATGGNFVIETRPNVIAADGSTALSFGRYASTKAAPSATGSVTVYRDGYFKPSTSTYRWTQPVATTKSVIAIPVYRNGPNVNDTNTGDMYLYGVRIVREPYNYEWS